MMEFGIKLRDKARQLIRPKDGILPSTIEKFGGYPLPIVGCTEAEIKEVMKRQNVSRLPQIYHSYLSAMGKYSGDINIGEDMDYGWLSSVKNHFRQYLETANLLLADDAFVFKGSQGVAYWYFLTANEDEDPPVYFWCVYYSDGDAEGELNDQPPHLLGLRLSEYLTRFIAERESIEVQQAFLNEYAKT
jgi:hypothetical protein